MSFFSRFSFLNPKAILSNRYVLLSLFLLAYSSIMESLGGLPSVLPAWRLELPLLLYLFFYAGRITKQSRFQALAASAPVVLSYMFTDVFYIMFGRLPRFAEVTEVPELIHVASPGSIALFCVAAGLPLLGYLALLDFRRFRAMALGAVPLAALVLCVKFYPAFFMDAFERTQKGISFYSDSDSAGNNGRMSMMLYNEAKRRSYRSKITKWLDNNAFQNKFDRLVDKVKAVNAKRNVHLVVLESFVDPELMAKAQYSRKPAHPDYDAFFKDKVGLSVSPVFCGGTAQAEFEALCGVPAMREISGVEFNAFTGARTFCAPNVLSRAGYHAIATNSYSPDFFNSVNAYTGIGFSSIYYPREFAPGRDTYFSTGDTTGEKYMFDGDLFSQNLEFIARRIKENPDTPIFNYIVGIYGHIPIAINTDKRPKVVSVKSNSKDDVLEATANQYYYRTEAIAAYVKGLLAIDPNSLIILMSDHLPTLDFGPITYKELRYLDGSPESMYLNRILIVENGKPVKYDAIHHFSVPRIILNYVTNGSYCKEEDCEFTSPKKKHLDREAYRDEYMAIMAHAMESEPPSSGAPSIVKASVERPGKDKGVSVAH
ncbi:MAG: sulfatase-like hydrolase/transferase [Nitrospinae bacterium]|nr:sulfatase-like hydrolase/transferase [Nitrospinota bacterium]